MKAKGKCPIDGRRRPVYIITDNKRVIAISDGYGDAYLPTGKTYMAVDDEILVENFIDPKDYEFDRGLTGFDF